MRMGGLVPSEVYAPHLEAFASLPVGLDVEEVQIEEACPREHDERDAEPGEREGTPQARSGKHRQEREEREHPQRKPGP